MKTGKYKENSINFEIYKASGFTPHIFYSPHYEAVGCGPATLSLLTGIPPTRSMLKVNPKHTSDRELLNILFEKGIESFPITKCEMSNDPVAITNKITNQHVVLISQLYRRNEASWGVLYDDVLYHNFRPCSWSNLDLLNRPVLSAYVLWKPEWRLNEYTYQF